MALAIGKAYEHLRRGARFGAYGAAGCAVAWVIGELVLLSATPSAGSSTPQAPSLLFDEDFNRRLAQAGAQTGEIQLSLKWHNHNDLDLHVIDPSGEHIYFDHRKSRSGGNLDVDRNADPPYTDTPVENVFWPVGGAPTGRYRVFVNHFNNQGGTDPTPFQVGVAIRGQPQMFEGSVSPKDLKEIHTFELGPPVPVAAPVGGGLSPATVVGIWSSIVAGCLAVALAVGQNRSLRRPWLTPRQAAVAAGGGILVGAASGALIQGLFGVVASGPFLTALGKAAGWTILGASLGWGMGWFIPNLPRNRAAAAGAAGGFLAAIVMVIGAWIFGQVVGRLLGVSILGFSIGLMIALAEAVGRDAWLVVRWGPKEESTVSLGKRAVSLGSSSEADIYLPKSLGFGPIVAEITLNHGTIEYEDKASGRKQVLRNGSKLKVGTLEVEVRVA